MNADAASTGRKALIIEGDESFANILTSFLCSHGIEASHTPDGQQGLWLASTISPNIVLLSLELKKSSSYLTLRGLKEDDALKRIPVIIMGKSDEGQEHDLLNELKDMAEDYIYKPFEDTEILRKVENFIGFAHEGEVDSTIETLLADKELAGDPELSALVRDIRARELEEREERRKAHELAREKARKEADVIPIEKAKKKDEKKQEEQQTIPVESLSKEKLVQLVKEYKQKEHKYEAEITELHTKLNDLSLDFSLEKESLKGEKDNLLKRLLELTERAKALEKALVEAKKTFAKGIKGIEKAL